MSEQNTAFGAMAARLSDVDIFEEPEASASQGMDAQRKADQRIAWLIADAFGGQDGLELLQWLESKTISLPVIAREQMLQFTPEQSMAYAHFREGENQVIRNIKTIIENFNRAEQG